MSAARTAKPSTFERSNDGTSTRAATSAARTRPSASLSAISSVPSGASEIAARNRALGFVAIDHVEELFLIGHKTARLSRSFALPSRIVNQYKKTSTSAPAGKPSLSAGTITKPSARVVELRIDAPLMASGSALSAETLTRA